MQPVHRTNRILSLALPLLLVAAALYGGYYWLDLMLQPPAAEDHTPVRIEVPAGASVAEAAGILRAAGLVRDATVFRYYTRYLGLDGQIRPGEYEFTRSMSPDQLLAKLTRGEVIHYRFTIPEGLTVVQMADHLDRLGLADRDRFIRVASEAAPLIQEFLPAGADLPYPLEGYLFPATYEYRKGIAEEEILQAMLARLRLLLKDEYVDRAREWGFTVHDLLTLASIIEKEAAVPGEREKISGVYHNRLAIGMKLDADPTVRYAINKPPEEPVLYKDLEVASPYNTYRNNGLPPGPIAAPGEASIRAALWPEKHDFYFFVAKGDGTGEHYFSRTLDEHEDYTARAEANRTNP